MRLKAQMCARDEVTCQQTIFRPLHQQVMLLSRGQVVKTYRAHGRHLVSPLSLFRL